MASPLSTEPSFTQAQNTLEQIRKLKFKYPVKSQIKGREALKQYLQSAMKEQMDIPAVEGTLKAFGFVPQDFHVSEFLIRLLTEQVLAYYDPKTKMFYLAPENLKAFSPSVNPLGGGAQDPSMMQQIVLLHELDHALQDQYFALEPLMKKVRKVRNDDRELAFQALMEGEATYCMMEGILAAQGLSLENLPNMGPVMEAMATTAAQGKELSDAPIYFQKMLLYPYAQGVGFVTSLVQQGGWSKVNEAYKSLPESTEEILHPEKYLRRDDPPAEVELSRWKKTGWTLLATNVLGEFQGKVLLEQFLPTEDLSRTMAGWRGDRYLIYQKGKEMMILWYTEWDTPGDAREFYDGYGKVMGAKFSGWQEAQRGESLQWSSGRRVSSIEMNGERVLILEGAPQESLPELQRILRRGAGKILL